MNQRDRLKSIGISEDRLRALGLGPPAKPADPTGRPFLAVAFDKHREAKRDDATAARAASEAAQGARADRIRQADAAAIEAWTAYRAAHPFEKASIRERVGSANLERGRQLAELADSADTGPRPPEAA
jgi:hypothetical protein